MLRMCMRVWMWMCVDICSECMCVCLLLFCILFRNIVYFLKKNGRRNILLQFVYYFLFHQKLLILLLNGHHYARDPVLHRAHRQRYAGGGKGSGGGDTSAANPDDSSTDDPRDKYAIVVVEHGDGGVEVERVVSKKTRLNAPELKVCPLLCCAIPFSTVHTCRKNALLDVGKQSAYSTVSVPSFR